MDDLDLAPRLRTLREKRQLSLRELGRRAGIAVSFLSALESGRNNVSVAKLKTILDVLGTTLGEFFRRGDDDAQTRVVHRKEELAEIAGPGRGISFKEVAAGRPGRALQLLVERYEPGCDTGSEGYRHQAEEAGVVLKGTLELTVDGQTYLLRAGDAYYFDSRLPHRFRNTGRTVVEAISVNTPPSF
jgi:transcriptional regulator with XRE-family HTH domain